MRIGILGGTFDPVHKGHLHLAAQAKRKLSLRKVLFIPAFVPPHKASRRQQISPAPLRWAMLRRALGGRRAFSLSGLEIKKKRKVYTVETLRALRRRYPPGTGLFFLSGADNLKTLHQWRDLDSIFRLCTFVVMTRPGFKKMGRYASRVLWLPIRPLAISSTDIRRRVATGKPYRHLLPSGVAAVIRANKMYSGARS